MGCFFSSPPSVQIDTEEAFWTLEQLGKKYPYYASPCTMKWDRQKQRIEAGSNAAKHARLVMLRIAENTQLDSRLLSDIHDHVIAHYVRDLYNGAEQPLHTAVEQIKHAGGPNESIAMWCLSLVHYAAIDKPWAYKRKMRADPWWTPLTFQILTDWQQYRDSVAELFDMFIMSGTLPGHTDGYSHLYYYDVLYFCASCVMMHIESNQFRCGFIYTLAARITEMVMFRCVSKPIYGCRGDMLSFLSSGLIRQNDALVKYYNSSESSVWPRPWVRKTSTKWYTRDAVFVIDKQIIDVYPTDDQLMYLFVYGVFPDDYRPRTTTSRLKVRSDKHEWVLSCITTYTHWVPGPASSLLNSGRLPALVPPTSSSAIATEDYATQESRPSTLRDVYPTAPPADLDKADQEPTAPPIDKSDKESAASPTDLDKDQDVQEPTAPTIGDAHAKTGGKRRRRQSRRRRQKKTTTRHRRKRRWIR